MKKKKVLKIGVDLRPLLSGRISGVETYLVQILENLIKVDKHNQYYFWTNAAKKFDFPEKFRAKNVKFIQTKWPNKILNFTSAFFGFPDYQRFFPEKLDIFWVTDPRPVVFKDVSILTTFHDLSPTRFPNFFNFRTRLWHRLVNFKRLAERSDRIIAVSKSTKDDLVKLYKIDKKKIDVVYEAASDEMGIAKKSEVLKVRKKYKLPRKYVLTLSTLEPRKNLFRLIEAFRTVKAMLKIPHVLVLAGVSNEKIFAKIPGIKTEKDIICTGFVSEQEKKALYSGADLFAYVSLLEGFGLPVAEALSCNVPVLIADNSSLPEVAGKAGVEVDPYKISAIVSGMRMVLKDSEKLKSLKKEAGKQKKEFSWKKTAKETLAVLESL